MLKFTLAVVKKTNPHKGKEWCQGNFEKVSKREGGLEDDEDEQRATAENWETRVLETRRTEDLWKKTPTWLKVWRVISEKFHDAPKAMKIRIPAHPKQDPDTGGHQPLKTEVHALGYP